MSYVAHQNKKVKVYFYNKILLFIKLKVLSEERERDRDFLDFDISSLFNFNNTYVQFEINNQF